MFIASSLQKLLFAITKKKDFNGFQPKRTNFLSYKNKK